MAGQLEVMPEATWEGAVVTACTRMPSGKVAVSRVGRSTVLVEPDDLARAGVIDRRSPAVGRRWDDGFWSGRDESVTVALTADPKEAAAEQGAACARPSAAVGAGRPDRRLHT